MARGGILSPGENLRPGEFDSLINRAVSGSEQREKVNVFGQNSPSNRTGKDCVGCFGEPISPISLLGKTRVDQETKELLLDKGGAPQVCLGKINISECQQVGIAVVITGSLMMNITLVGIPPSVQAFSSKNTKASIPLLCSIS